MAKKKNYYSTDELLNMAQKCEAGNCNSKCPYYGKENCKNRLLRRIRQRLWRYYSVVGELD